MAKRRLLAIIIALILVITPIVLLRATSFPTNKAPVTSPIRVACVGDSITEKSKYTADLQSMLGPKYLVGNFGVSGSTVSLSTYKPYMDQPQFQDAENFEPDVVVIMLGTNDAHSDLQQYSVTFEGDYGNLIDSFQNLSSTPQVLVVESPPVYNNTLDLNSTFFSSTIIPHIQNVANQQNLPAIDVYDTFGNRSDYTVDGIHPNDDGAALIASQVYNAITPVDTSSAP